MQHKTLQRWMTKLLDGEKRWGFLRIQPDRFGVTRYRLVVYPPGISDTERRQLRIWRGAPIWGGALWALLEIFLQQLVVPWTALAMSTGTVVTLAVVALAKTGDIRTKVRTTAAVTMAGHPDVAAIAARDRLLSLAMTLTYADERLDDERMSPLDHEALWWSVYEQLAPAHPATSARSRD